MTAELRVDNLAPGKNVGKFRLGRQLGKGGFGVVYEAYDTEDAVRVALKVTDVDRSTPTSLIAFNRFQQEVEAVRRIRHPNVVQVYDSALLQGTGQRALAYYTMELLEGRTLGQAIKDDGPLPHREAIRVVRQAAAGLHRAHGEGIVHRDVKPGNIFLAAGQRTVLMDFGICKLGDGAGNTLTGQVVGTPRYLAPEQMVGGTVDARTDVFALGALLFFALTGKHLRPGATVGAVFMASQTDADRQRILAEEQLPEVLRDVLLTAVAKLPGERFASARAMAEALEATDLLLGTETSWTRSAAPAAADSDDPSDATSQDLVMQTLGGSLVRAQVLADSPGDVPTVPEGPAQAARPSPPRAAAWAGGLVDAEVLYAAARRLHDPALSRVLEGALDLLAPLSHVAREAPNDPAGRDVSLRATRVARLVVQLATTVDEARRGRQPRAHDGARLDQAFRMMNQFAGKQAAEHGFAVEKLTALEALLRGVP